MEKVEAGGKKLYKVAIAVQSRYQVSRLYSRGDKSSKLLANAIRETLVGERNSEERERIEEIESLRTDLEHSGEEIPVVDHGAGSSNSGTQTTRTTVGEMCRKASKPPIWCLLLFKLIREFRPSGCLELGTCLGVSASYQASALKLNRAEGSLITLEGSEPLAKLAKGNLQTLDLDNVTVVVGRFQDTLDEILKGDTTIDYAFVDGHHDENATLDYFERIFPFLSDDAVLVFDDISWSEGMKRAWRTIQEDTRIGTSVDLQQVGVCLLDRGAEKKQNFKVRMAR